MKTTLNLIAAATMLLSPALASADAGDGASATASDTDTGYAYEFDDDIMNGDGIGANAARIKVRPGHVRRTLIRPRLHFVPELLKSVELI